MVDINSLPPEIILAMIVYVETKENDDPALTNEGIRVIEGTLDQVFNGNR